MQRKKEHVIIYRILLLLASVIWGLAVVAQSIGGKTIGPMYFNGIRCYIGFFVTIPPMIIYKKKAEKHLETKIVPTEKALHNLSFLKNHKKLLFASIMCGLTVGMANIFQQYGLMYTTAGNSGFITAMYILIVPIFGVFMKKHAGKKVWFGIILAIIGMYFLCIDGKSTINFGDIITLIGAFFYAWQIIIVDKYATEVNPIAIACIEFFVAGTMSMIIAIFTESLKIANLKCAIIPLFYAGVLSCGVAYTLQIIGQKKTPPALASLLMSGESVFGLIGGLLILGESPSINELRGCFLMLVAIIIAQIPMKKLKECLPYKCL